MLKGIFFALSACFIWGFIFIIPQFLKEFSPIQIALGRYTFYGLISLLIFFKRKIKINHTINVWLKALYFSFVSTFLYYISIILSLRYSDPAVCTLILGVSPVTISFYGNWKKKEYSFAALILPSILIIIGLMLINAPHFAASVDSFDYILGVFCSLIGLIAWSWFVVANSKLLNDNPNISPHDWSTLIGVGALFWVIVCGNLLLALNQEMTLDLASTPPNHRFFVGSAFLGIVCSWCGAYLWNQASLRLPVSFAGQLTIFETIFGLSFVYLLSGQMPPPLECLGVMILLGAVGYSVHFLSKSQTQEAIS